MYKLNSFVCCFMVLFALSFNNAWAKKEKIEHTVSGISLDVLRIDACAREKGCVAASGPMQIDLLDLADGKVDFASKVLLPAKTKELRLVLSDNSTITVDDESFPLDVPSGRHSGLKLKGQKVFGKEGGFLTGLTLSLDLKKQLVIQAKKGKSQGHGKGKGKSVEELVYSYKLKPVVAVKTAEVEPLPENMVAAVALPEKETVLKEGDDDLVVTIPAGAVSEPKVITARKIENAFYELNPDGQKFIEPVLITMSYAHLFYREAGYSEDSLIILRNEVEFPSSKDIYSKTITASTKEFSSWEIVAKIAESILLLSCNKNPSHDDFSNIISIMKDDLKWNTAADFMKHWLDDDMNDWFKDDQLNRYFTPSDLEKYDLISGTFDYLKERAEANTLFDGDVPRTVLIDELKKRTYNDNGLPVIPYGGHFSHIEIELENAGGWNADKAEWDESKMFYSVDKSICKKFDCKKERFYKKDEYIAAFGSSSLRAVASGDVTIDNNVAKINIKQAGIYFRDSYDFTGKQFLGCWSTVEPYVALTPNSFMNMTPIMLSDGIGSPVFLPSTNPPYLICVCNESFRNYNISNREDENYGSFRIFTKPEEYIVNTNQTLTYNVPNIATGAYCGQEDINQDPDILYW